MHDDCSRYECTVKHVINACKYLEPRSVSCSSTLKIIPFSGILRGTKSVVFFYRRLNRASQTYFFPIHLTEQLLPSAVFYATVGPLVFYLAIQRLVIKPYVRAQQEQ